MRAAEYHYLEENGIAYISVSSFHDQGANAAVYEEFVRTGAQMRDCKAIIFDLRSNGGGNGASMYRWVESFTGIYPELREARAERKSILNSGYTQSVYEGIRIGRGSWISNNIPIIVLMNDACGSAGESALNLLRGMENVLVVGSNSAGYQLGGNAEVITLPNTGITAQIGTQLRFMFEVENVDLKGYEPDVWCDPDQALGAAMNLLVKNGLTTEETVQSLQKTATEIRAEITLGFYQYTVWPGNGFGSNGGSHTITVYCNGEPVQDFTVSSANPSACTVEKTANGTFRLTSKGPGLTAITVQCGSRKEVFYWNSNSQ